MEPYEVDTINNRVWELVDTLSGNLTHGDYRELLQIIKDQTVERLDALDADEA